MAVSGDLQTQVIYESSGNETSKVVHPKAYSETWL